MLKQQIFMKICSVGSELFHGHGRIDRHDEANSLRSFVNAPKNLSRCFTLALGVMVPNSDLRGDRPPPYTEYDSLPRRNPKHP